MAIPPVLLGCNYPFLNNPAIAVDLFMMLSGLFIANTFDVLRSRHAYVQASRYFWIRRVMRIWPLYAVVLTICWLCIEPLDDWMQMLTTVFPRTTAGADNYFAPHYHWPTLSDAAPHYSMLFGLVPTYAASTPLPDWSLSLEFQFYLLFPLLFLALRSRLLLICVLAAVAAYLSPALFGFYLEPGRFAHFEQPSPLCYKLNLFLVGVLAHRLLKLESDKDRGWHSLATLLVALVICLAVTGFLTTLGIALIFYLLLWPESWLAQRLSLPVPRFFGEISYTIYLVHRPVLLGIASTLASYTGFVALPAALRFGVAAALVFIFTLLVSWALYLVIERPGNRLGHRWTNVRTTKLLPAAEYV